MSVFGGPDIVTDGLVLHLDAANRKSYPLSGSTIYDLSGNGNNGTINGATFDANNNGSFDFNGSSNYIAITNPYRNFTNEITVEWWTKRNGTLAGGSGWGMSQQNTDTVNNTYFLMHSSNNTGMTFYVRDPSFNAWRALSFGADSVDTSPCHLVGTVSSSKVATYKNGNLIGTATGMSGNMTTYASPIIHLGKDPRYASGRFYDGNIYTAIVYNRELSADEIAQNYNALKGRFGL